METMGSAFGLVLIVCLVLLGYWLHAKGKLFKKNLENNQNVVALERVTTYKPDHRRPLKLTEFKDLLEKGLVPKRNEYDDLNMADFKLHVQRFSNKIARANSSHPCGSMNR